MFDDKPCFDWSPSKDLVNKTNMLWQWIGINDHMFFILRNFPALAIFTGIVNPMFAILNVRNFEQYKYIPTLLFVLEHMTLKTE